MTVSTAISASSRASILGVKTQFKNLRPSGSQFLQKRIAVIGVPNELDVVQGEDKQLITSSVQAGNLYGWGSPLHLVAKELFPDNGDGVGSIPVTFYPIWAGIGLDGSDVKLDIANTASQDEIWHVEINNVRCADFLVEAGDNDSTPALYTRLAESINAVLDIHVIAEDNTTSVNCSSKWGGSSSNVVNEDSYVFVGPEGSTTQFTSTNQELHNSNPDITPALNQIGEVWETFVINCMEVEDTDTLDILQEFGEGRWLPFVDLPFLSFCGDVNPTVSNAIAIPNSRKTDRVNCQINIPGSLDLPFLIAARAVARIAIIADSNPPKSYQRSLLDTRNIAPSGLEWTPLERDQALKAGSSTSEIVSGDPSLVDVVTFYHPDGESDPAWRYAVSHVKVWEINYSTKQIFEGDDWAAAPLIPDDQATTNKEAKKPKMAKAAIAEMIDNLALSAILSDPDTAKATIQAEIDGGNPNRLNVSFTAQISGNTNIKSIDFYWGFYFGGNV